MVYVMLGYHILVLMLALRNIYGQLYVGLRCYHCAAPVMWGNVRPWATMLGSNVLLWFEACIFMILTLDGKIFREKLS